MERGASEFSRSGLNTPYTATFNDASVDSPAEHQSPASYPAQEVRPVNYPASATPTSEYSVHPSSARSSSFPEHIQRQYYPSSSHSGSSGGMAQPTSPSLPLQDGASNHHAQQIKSDQDVPIDPSIAASSPTYPPHGGPYSAYPPQQEMSHAYPQHPGGPMYAQQPRPDWAGYGQHPQHGMPAPYPSSGVSNPNSAAPSGPRPGQVSIRISCFHAAICAAVLARANSSQGCLPRLDSFFAAHALLGREKRSRHLGITWMRLRHCVGRMELISGNGIDMRLLP